MIFMRMHPTVFYQSTTKDVVYGFQVAGTNIDMIIVRDAMPMQNPITKKPIDPNSPVNRLSIRFS